MRFYLTEFKLKKQLELKTGHLSRLLTYYLSIALILGFSSHLFWLIVIVALPTMIAAFLGFDLTFYKEILQKDPKWKENRGWLILERITLHPPMIIAGFWLYFMDPKSFFTPLPSGIEMFVGILLSIGAFLFVDPRWRQKEDWPTGIVIFFGACAEALGFILYLYYF